MFRIEARLEYRRQYEAGRQLRAPKCGYMIGLLQAGRFFVCLRTSDRLATNNQVTRLGVTGVFRILEQWSFLVCLASNALLQFHRLNSQRATTKLFGSFTRTAFCGLLISVRSFPVARSRCYGD